jgi:ABC-2 type transport system ATP-binding protein
VTDDRVIFDNVSRFYGEVLGVNRVTLSIPPGITSLVGPNGSGKTTLMNLMSGLVQPSRGAISVLGIPPTQPHRLFGLLGYSTQFDSFPRGMTGLEFVQSFLRLYGLPGAECRKLADAAIARVRLGEAAGRKIAGYSKGMRQRIRLAQAIAHDPRVLVLDEPLNGLDPLVRAETLALFREFAAQGRHVIVSSHILHEVDVISDRVILLSSGYVMAEGSIQGVRSELQDHPTQILVLCNKPADLAARVFAQELAVEARLLTDKSGLVVRTHEPDRVYRAINRAVMDGLEVVSVAPVDDDVNSVYGYLIGGEAATA